MSYRTTVMLNPISSLPDALNQYAILLDVDGTILDLAPTETSCGVLGFDTERSTDHGWGPCAQVFVSAEDVAAVAARIDSSLPERYRDWPVRFGWDEVPVRHHVEVSTLEAWLAERLGFDPLERIETVDWLTVPQQHLLEATAGAVFHDGLGRLEAARRSLAWYPEDVWLW